MIDTGLNLEISKDELRNKLAELIRIQSVVEDGHTESGVVEAVTEWCTKDTVPFETFEVAPGRFNLLMEWKGNQAGPTLLFEAHSDTVTAGDVEQWTRPPFQLTPEGDRLYGRGTADTKGNLVAAYVGLRELVRRVNGAFSGRIQLLIPIDEEGMMTGIRHYITSGGAKDVAAAICCEPEDAQVCIRQKGALRIRVEIRGKMAHGAMPLAGNNPLPVLARFLLAVAEEERQQQDRLGFDRYLGWPSITPTQIQAPIKGPSGFNVMPDSVAVSLDIRTVAGQSHSELTGRLREVLDRVILEANQELTGYTATLRERLKESINAGEYQATLHVLDDRPVTDTNRDDPIVKAVASAVEARLHKPAIYSGVPGATDGTWLWNAGIPIVTTGAGNRYVPHQRDEWVSLQQLHDMAHIYADAAYRFLSNTTHKTGVEE